VLVTYYFACRSRQALHGVPVDAQALSFAGQALPEEAPFAHVLRGCRSDATVTLALRVRGAYLRPAPASSGDCVLRALASCDLVLLGEQHTRLEAACMAIVASHTLIPWPRVQAA